MMYKNIAGVPDYDANIFAEKQNKYCVLIPIINEGERIKNELSRAFAAGVHTAADIIICDGGSTDGSLDAAAALGVNTVLVKKGAGKQGAQLRMGLHFALARGYDGIVTIDGNDKDSIEDIPRFIKKLDEGFDYVQGSRFIKGGRAINTPLSRYIAVRLIHAPIIRATSHTWLTDTTNNFRAYSRRYLEDARVKPLRDIFIGYELLAYLSTRAGQLGLKVCEIPVTRAYPKNEPAPTKIKGIKGNTNLLNILFANMLGRYTPKINEE